MEHKTNSITLRSDESDRIDDVVVEDVTMFRMEHMHSNIWWLRVYTQSGNDLVISIKSETPPSFEIDGPLGGKVFKGTVE